MSALVILCLLVFAPGTVGAQQDDAEAKQIVALINGWRIEQGTWPLRENATLQRIAYDQASYVLSLPSIPLEGNIHLDAQGRGPAVRARLPKYDWTPYGADVYTEVGEIAYVGANQTAARRFWDGSTIHHNTLLNPAYREIGVAVLPHRYGYLYMVEFGSRPNVFPALADVQSNRLYLSNEGYSWARSPFIRSITQVRLFDADGRPLETDWLPWQMTIALPKAAGNQVYVEYSDGGSGVALAAVPLDAQTAALPTILPSATPTRAAATPNATGVPTLGSPVVTGTLASVSSTATVTPAPVQGNSVTLLYDSRSFTLINTGQTAINVEEIVFAGRDQSFAVTRWATQWLSGSLSALAANDCLGVWSWTEATEIDKPSRCRQRRSVLTVAPAQMFWKLGDFDVRWRDSMLVTCHASETSCEFKLP